MSEFLRNLEHSFEELGVSFDNEILQQCLKMCKKYDINDAEEFVDAWMAYSVSHLQGENPTIAHLVKFEREEFTKKSKEVKKTSAAMNSTPLITYEANQSYDMSEASSIMKAYNETTPRRQSSQGRCESLEGHSKKNRSYGSSPQPVFSPIGFSPIVTVPSANYTNRKNAGNIVCNFNGNELNERWKSQNNNYMAKIELKSRKCFPKYMCYDLMDFLDLTNASIEQLGSLICEKYSLVEVMPVRYKHPSPFVTVGRIVCDGEGRLNANSIRLEGPSHSSIGESVYLDLSGLGKYSVFPGQIVAVEGYNLTEDRLMVKEMYVDATPGNPKAPGLAKGPLNIVIAAGPFTTSDSLTYQPLLDLIEEVVKDEPHALILTGPLIDSNHPIILQNTLAETFEDLLARLIDKIMKPLEKKKTQVVIVSSIKDCTSNFVYPTPEFTLKTRSYAKLHLLPDPSIFTIEDVVIGVTATDVLLHMSKEEISSCLGSGRMSRLAGHILGQRSFYPLNPATEIPVDPTLMNFAKLDESPHLLILPSDLRFFMTEVAGSVVLNPERLAKGVIGGTFARVIISKDDIVGNIYRI